MIHRQNNVLKTTSSKPDFAASYTVLALPVGAVASAASSGTTATVDAGHGFAAGDLVLIYDGTTSTFVNEALASVTGTTLVWTAATPTVAKSDLLCNLGPDPGTGGTPDYDASPMVIYSDADGSDAVTNSQVTSDTTGNYDYYYKGDGRSWELIRDSSGTVAAVVPGWGGQACRFNVADWGTAGDGATDDETRIQAAITGANAIGGGGVFVPEGTHILGAAIEMDSLVHLYGAGRSSIVKMKDSTNLTMFNVGTETDAEISKLQLDGNKANQSSAGNGIIIWSSSVRCVVRDCYIHDTFDRGVRVSSGAEDCIVTDNHFKDIGTTSLCIAIDFDGSSTPDLERCIASNNIIDGSTQKGIHVKSANSCVVANNIIEEQLTIGIETSDADNCLIIGNQVHSLNGTFGISLSSSTGGVVSGNSVTGTITGGGIEVASTDFVAVTGNFVKGALGQGIVLDDADYCTVSGNVVTDCGNAVAKGGIRVFADGTQTANFNSITGNVVEAPAAGAVHGIELMCNAVGATVQHNVVSGNTLHGNNVASSEGISITNSGSGTMSGNLVGDNVIVNWAEQIGDNEQTAPTAVAASTTTLPETGSYISITGATGITNITKSSIGRRVTLSFVTNPVITDGGNLKLAGNFSTVATDTLTLICDGTNWTEVSRSVVSG